VIFAFLFAVIAYGVGVPTVPSIVSQTSPGSPAWQANLAPGDEIVSISGEENPTFEDLRSNVTLGDLENGIEMLVREADSTGASRKIVLKPTRGSNQGLATIGIAFPFEPWLHLEEPVAPHSPVARATRVAGEVSSRGASEETQDANTAPDGFQPGDRIVRMQAVGDEQVYDIGDYRDFSAVLSRHLEEPLEVTVRRGEARSPSSAQSAGAEFTYRVEPRPLKRLGLVMEMGKVVAVQQDSPAAEAGLKEGDFIQLIDDKRVNDPMELPHELRQRALEAQREGRPAWISLTVKRSRAEGEDESRPFGAVKLRVPQWLETVAGPDMPLECAPLGIAYHVLNRVDRVIPGSPAAKAGLRNGDQIERIEFLLAEDAKPTLEDLGIEQTISFSDESHNWPFVMEVLQSLAPRTKLRMTVQRAGKMVTVDLEAYVPTDEGGQPVQFHVKRGFNLQVMRRIQQAKSFSEQVEMGFDKTVDSLLLVYRFLEKLITTQVPVTALGGPITIAQATYYSAFEGFGRLLIFLTILSANLAVINFLPIPLLDGGHMVFLAYEGIRRRPPNERFVVALHTIGFVFIISLMLFVIVLDLGLIKRNL
jgi:regulator of sigma E protease